MRENDEVIYTITITGITSLVKQGASCAIDVQPFSHAPGYPQGDLSL